MISEGVQKDLLAIGLIQEASESDPPSDELVKQMWNELQMIDPNPRWWVFEMYIEKNFPEYKEYTEYIWSKFPNKTKINYREG